MAKADATSDTSSLSKRSVDAIELDEEIEVDEEELDEEGTAGPGNDDDGANADEADQVDVRIVMPPTFDVETWLHAPISGQNELAYQLGRLVNAINCCSLLAQFQMDEQEHRNVLLLADLVTGLAGRFFPPPLVKKLQRTARNEYGNDGTFGDTDHMESIECHWEADDDDSNPNTPSNTIARHINNSPIDQILQSHWSGTEFMAWYKLGKVVDAGVRPLQSDWANGNLFMLGREHWADACPDATWFGVLKNAWSGCIGLVQSPPTTDPDRLTSEIVPGIDAAIRGRLGLKHDIHGASGDDEGDDTSDWRNPPDSNPPADFYTDEPLKGTQGDLAKWCCGSEMSTSRGLRMMARRSMPLIWVRAVSRYVTEVFFRTKERYDEAAENMRKWPAPPNRWSMETTNLPKSEVPAPDHDGPSQ